MKCTCCYREHPKGGWPWRIFDVPVYWSLPDDGASITCKDCNQEKPMEDVYLTQLTCGSRRVICLDCIDEDWLKIAHNEGTFPD